MRYGESVDERAPALRSLADGDTPNFVVRNVSVGLYRAERPRGEIFPPSTGELALTTTKLVCRKERAVRMTAPADEGLGDPGGPVIVQELGSQWFSMDLDEVQDTGRTKLLRHNISVEGDDGSFEVVLGPDSRSARVVRRLERIKGDN